MRTIQMSSVTKRNEFCDEKRSHQHKYEKPTLATIVMKEYSSSLREHLLRDELFGNNCSENVNGGGNCALCRMGPQPWNW